MRAVAAVRSAAIELTPTMSGSEALQRIGLACLDHVRRNEAAALAGDTEAIHQMRVGLRRLRAALSGFGKLLPRRQWRLAAKELRWPADALAAARNLDVFESGLLAPARNALGDIDGLSALSAAAAQRRKAAHLRAAKVIASRRYALLLRRTTQWFETRGWTENARSARALAAPIGEIAPLILDRRHRAAARHAKGFAGQTAEERHQLRIALKKLRYMAEMLGSLYGVTELPRFTKPLRRLQDNLGEANDVRVGRDLIAELMKSKGARTAAVIGEAGRVVLGWHEDRLRRCEPAMRRHLDRLVAASPFWLG